MHGPATNSTPALAAAFAPVKARPRFPLWLLAALLGLLTIALYWPATGHDFVNYDDPDYVTANPQVQGGLSWAGVKWAFSNPVCSNWHPLTILSHMLDYQAFGLNPWGHHWTSVLFHTLNAMLVFALLQQMTGAPWRSLWVAALFAVHPLRVESVAWVAERKDVLSAFFGLLTLIFYARWAARTVISNQWPVTGNQESEPPASRITHHASRITHHASRFTFHVSRYYLLSLACFALGLLSKPMLVTWPFVMLLLDYWPLERFHPRRAGRLLAEKIPFFALAAATSLVAFMTQQHAGSVITAESLPLGARGANALVSGCRYLGKLFWPADLAVFYPHPGHWPLTTVLLAGGLLLGLSGLLLVQRQRFPFLLIGWLWFLGTLVPVIGLVQVGALSMADRYTYLPLIGVLILLVWGAYELTRGWPCAAMTCSVAGAVAILLCLALTRQQLGHWQNSETLFRHALKVTQDNSLAHNNLAAVLVKQGQVDEAIGHYQEAIRLQPDYADAHYNLGNARLRKGQWDDAIRQYQQVLRRQPDYAEAHNNLGLALVGKGQAADAIIHYREAVRRQPDYAEAHSNLGFALGRLGQMDEAIRQFQEVIRLKADNADTHYYLGNAFGRQGRMDEAIRQFQETLRRKPDYAEAHYNLGLALGKQGQTAAAIRQYEEALRLKPDYPSARDHLARAREK